MNKNLKRVGFLLVLVIGLFNNLQAQTFTVKDWCENGYADWTVSSSIPSNVKYHWYKPIYNTAGTVITSYTDLYYGGTANGSFFSSAYANERYTTPSPVPTAPAWYERKFAYKIETSLTGVYSSTSVVAANTPTDAANYFMTAVFSQDIRLTSFKAPLNNLQANNTYAVQVKVTNTATNVSQYSSVYSFKGQSGTNIGNGTYLQEIPINLDITSGTYKIELVTPSPLPSGMTALANDYRWFPIADYNTFTTKTQSGVYNISSATFTTWGTQEFKPVYFDWKFTAFSNYTLTPAAVKQTDPSKCCTPVLATPSINYTSNIIVSGTDNTTLSLGSFSSESNYFAWYRDGIAVTPSGAGVNKTTLTTNQAGVYSVREVQNNTFLNDISCYASTSTAIQERKLFAKKSNSTVTSYCVGDEVEVEAYGSNFGSVLWEPQEFFSNPTAKKTTAILGALTGSVNLKVSSDVYTDNKIVDGDFSGPGNFTSDLSKVSDPGNTNGSYTIASKVPAAIDGGGSNTNWSNCKGDGNFMIVNASDNTSKSALYKTGISGLTLGKEYTLSLDMTNISFNDNAQYLTATSKADIDVEFQIFINNVAASPVLSTSANGDISKVCVWENKKMTWIADATDINFEIRQVNKFNGAALDFGIDNILFGGPSTQTATVVVTPVNDCYEVDVTKGACVGDSVLLTGKAINASTGKEVGVIEKWERKGNPGVIVGKGSEIYVKPTVSDYYIAYGSFPAGSIIQNGDFELGVNGFKYGSANGLYDLGTNLAVVTKPKGYNGNNWFADMADHTSGTGKMLLVDPKTTDGDVIAYDFTAISGKDYLFSLFAANAVDFTQNQNPILANVSFIINGPSAANVKITQISLPASNDWKQLSSVWTAPSNGNYTLTIRALGDNNAKLLTPIYPSNQAASGGNDFVIDDIKLAVAIDNIYKDSIQVIPCAPTALDTTITMCSNAANPAQTIGAYDLTSLNNYVKGGVSTASVAWYTNAALTTAVTTPTAVIGISNGTKFYTKITDTNKGGEGKSVVTFTINANPKVGKPTTIADKCVGDAKFTYPTAATGTTAFTPIGGVFKAKGVGTPPTPAHTKITSLGEFTSDVAGIYENKYIVTDATTTCKDSVIFSQVVNSAPSFTLTQPSAQCEGNYNLSSALSAITPATPTTALTYFKDTTLAAIANPVSATGTYYVKATANGCSTKYGKGKVDVKIDAKPSASITTTALEYCSDAATKGVNLTAAANATLTAATYKWLESGTTTPSLATGQTPTFKFVGNKDYVVEVTNGTCVETSAKVTVAENLVPQNLTIATTDTKTSYCEGDIHTLTASSTATTPATTYAWTIATAPGATTAAQTGVTTAGVRKYEVTATTSKGCTSKKSVDITINALPTALLTLSKANACEGDVIKVTDGNFVTGKTYTWTVTGGTSVPNATDGSTSITAATTDLKVTNVIVTDANGCKSVALTTAQQKTIPVDAKPTVATGSDASVCVAEAITMTGNTPTIGVGKWINISKVPSTSSAAITDVNSSKSAVTGLAGGDKLTATWEIKSTNDYCPKSSKVVTITGTGIADPIVSLSASVASLCEGETVDFVSNGSNGGSGPVYTLHKEDDSQVGTSNATGAFPGIAIAATEKYYVKLVSNSSCLSSPTANTAKSALVTVTADKEPSLANIIEVDETICSDGITLTTDPIISGIGAWTISSPLSGSVAVVSPAGIVSGIVNGEVVTVTYTVASALGKCTPETDNVKLTRAGTLTTSNVSGQSTTICEGETAPALTGTALNASASPAETGKWTPKSGTTATITQSGINATVSGLTVGDNEFEYEITNGLCTPSVSTVKITVIAKPVADIVGYTDGATITQNAADVTLNSAAPASGYTHSWELINPTSSTATKTESGLSATINSLEYDKSVSLVLSVVDAAGECDAVKETVIIERKNITEAKAKDETICISSPNYTQTPESLPNASLGETAEWIAGAGSPTPATGTNLNVTFTTAGDYTYTYKISNPTILDGTGNPIKSEKTITIKVDAEVVTPTAGTSDNICTEPYALSGSALQVGEKGLWTGTGVTFADATNPTTTISGLTAGSTYTLNWTVSSKYGVCPSVPSTDLTLKRLKAITPAVISPIAPACFDDAAIVVSATPVDASNNEIGKWSSSDVTIPVGQEENSALDIKSLISGKGEYTLTWTTSSTVCTGSDSKPIVVTVNDKPAQPQFASGNPTEICEGETLPFSLLSPTVGGTYNWNVTESLGSVTSGSVADLTATAQASVTTGEFGTPITLKVKENNVCGDSPENQVDVAVKLTPRDFIGTITTLEASVCTGKAQTFEVENQGVSINNYKWEVAGLLPKNTTAPSLTLTSAEILNLEGTKNVKVTLANRCGLGVSKTELFDFIKAREFSIEASLTESGIATNDICNEKEYDLEIRTPNTLNKGVDLVIGSTTLTDYSLPFPMRNLLGESLLERYKGQGNKIEIKATANSEECLQKFTAETVVELISRSLNQPTLNAQAPVCEDDKKGITMVDVANADTSLVEKWVWNQDGSEVIKTNVNSINITRPDQSGDYTVRITSKYGCESYTSNAQPMQIDVKPFLVRAVEKVVVYVNPRDPQPAQVVPIQVTNLAEGEYGVSWTAVPQFGRMEDQEALGYLIPGTVVNPTLGLPNVEETVVYTVEVTNNTCTTDTNITVVFTKPFFPPTAFTPNGDGKNDTWVIDGMNNYPRAALKIYNRWGNAVYQKNGVYTGEWSGDDLPAGTYYWTLDFGTKDKNPETGTITIVR